MTDCIFCKIAKGEIPSSKIYEDDDFLAFLDIAPANKGHCLIIPKEHYETYTDLPEEILIKLAKVAQKVAKSIVDTTSANGFNIFMNNKPSAGQIVPHAHFHIVPRFQGDGINFDWPKQKYEEREMAELATKISQNL
ncbi:HIT family protein [Nanoarchaeota archaeon]